jgi:hypothetical protein
MRRTDDSRQRRRLVVPPDVSGKAYSSADGRDALGPAKNGARSRGWRARTIDECFETTD